MQKQQQIDNPMLCPSFNSYSSDKFAEIATKVTQEQEFQADDSETLFADDDDFEFSLVLDHGEASADEIFHQGPVFPIFSRDLLPQATAGHENTKRDGDASALRVPLKNLFLEEREPSSSTSSEADELETVPPGTYCVWRPKVVESSPSICKKSKSTGSHSKRFRIRDLIGRSNSDGKDSFVFLTPKTHKHEKAESSEKVEKPKLRRKNSIDSDKTVGKLRTPPSPASSAHELFYVQNRAMKEGDRRKSFLPYRKDLVGFFANVNGLGNKSSKTFFTSSQHPNF